MAGSPSPAAAPASISAFKAPLPPPTNLDVHRNENITFAPPTDESQLFTAPWVHDDSFDDIQLDVTLMPQFIHSAADSPTSTLSNSPTQLSFEDSRSSTSSSRFSLSSASSLGTDDPFFVDPFAYTNISTGPYFDGSGFTNQFGEIKTEQYFVTPFDDPLDLATMPFDYKHHEPIHRSMDVPSSPQLVMSTFTPMESYERTIPEPSMRTFEHPMTTYLSPYAASLSSDDTPNDPAPPTSPLPKKPVRVSKQDKGIKCDHCGIEKTPLWRKVPSKENAYHCNACGLYYKSNGHFRALEGDTRVIRHKKSRKNSDPNHVSNLRSGPVTANRNLTCYNCNTNNTVLWRKGPEGQSPLCNPCGLFYKLHGSHRDPEKKKEIHRRNRAGKKRHSLPSQRRSSWTSESSENEEDETDTADSPVVSHFDFRRHSTASTYVKEEYMKEEIDYSRTMVSPTQEFMTPPYPFQWGQSQSVQGRA